MIMNKLKQNYILLLGLIFVLYALNLAAANDNHQLKRAVQKYIMKSNPKVEESFPRVISWGDFGREKETYHIFQSIQNSQAYQLYLINTKTQEVRSLLKTPLNDMNKIFHGLKRKDYITKAVLLEFFQKTPAVIFGLDKKLTKKMPIPAIFFHTHKKWKPRILTENGKTAVITYTQTVQKNTIIQRTTIFDNSGKITKFFDRKLDHLSY